MTREKAGKWVLSFLLWIFGGTFYFFIEVVWKTAHGNTVAISWTMLVVAIILSIPLERCGAGIPWEWPLFHQAIVCTIAITITEFVSGCVLNLWLGLRIWDYSELPGNILGQVAPSFVAAWLFLSIFAIVLFDWMRYAVEGGERPHYTIV